MFRKQLLSFCLVLTSVACTLQSWLVPGEEAIITPSQTPPNTPTLRPTATETPTSTPTPVPPTATETPLPDISEEYWQYTIDHLCTRPYGGGQVEVLEVMEERETFTRYLIRYPSDELTIYGGANIPKGSEQAPVVIMLHGYGNSNKSTIIGSKDQTADALAENGYLVLYPNLRGYPPSDSGDNLFRVGMAVDILNLIDIIREQAGQPGLFEKADPTRIGLLGHSLGGGVALRVATVSENIKAMVLSSSTSADESKNAELFYALTENQIHLKEMETPPDVMKYISPLDYFDKISASVKLYHSTTDDIVPLAWASETCEELQANNVDVDCFYYIGADHTFSSGFQTDFRNTMLEFFESKLKGP